MSHFYPAGSTNSTAMFLKARIINFVNVCFSPQTNFGIVGFHPITRSYIMATWKRAPKEKCPMIPCRTNVSGPLPGIGHLNFDWLFFYSQYTMQKTISLNEPFELDSSFSFNLSIPIKCMAQKDLRLRDEQQVECQRDAHLPFLSTLDSMNLKLFQGARNI